MKITVFDGGAFKRAIEHVDAWEIPLPRLHHGPIGPNDKRTYNVQSVVLLMVRNLFEYLSAIDAYRKQERVPDVQPFVKHLAFILKLLEISDGIPSQADVVQAHQDKNIVYQQVWALGEIADQIANNHMGYRTQEVQVAALTLLYSFYTLCEEDNFPWHFDTLCEKVTQYQFN